MKARRCVGKGDEIYIEKYLLIKYPTPFPPYSSFLVLLLLGGGKLSFIFSHYHKEEEQVFLVFNLFNRRSSPPSFPFLLFAILLCTLSLFFWSFFAGEERANEAPWDQKKKRYYNFWR